MNRREAKKIAVELCANLIRNSVDSGWPVFNGANPEWLTENEEGYNADGHRVEAAVLEVAEELYRRADR